MRVKSLAVGGIVAGILAVGPMTPAFAEDTEARSKVDNRIEDRIEAAFEKDEALSHLEIDVDQRVLTLTGEVASLADRSRAEKLAKAAGAKRIVNRLEVDADKAVARIKERAEAKKERIDDRALEAKERVDQRAETAAERVERRIEEGDGPRRRNPNRDNSQVRDKDEVIDPMVTTRVKTRIIADDLLDDSDINVDTGADGRVTLRGTVNSPAAKRRALELARTTAGVRQVVDEIVVKAPILREP